MFQLADATGALRTVSLAEWEQRQCPNEVGYVDGACYPHVIPSLARAGWAGVFTVEGKITAIASTPVWHPAIQSSGVAEWTSICGITQLQQRPYYRLHRLRRPRSRRRRAPADPFCARCGTAASRAISSTTPTDALSPPFTVKAHVDAHAVAHYEARPPLATPPPTQQQSRRPPAIERAIATRRVAGHVLPLWRAARTFHFQRDAAADALALPTRRAPLPPVTRQWEPIPTSATWRGRACLAVTRCGPALRTRWRGRCAGFNSTFRAILAQAQGHTLVVGVSGALPFA